MKVAQRVLETLARAVGALLLLLASALAPAQTVTYFHNDPSSTPMLAIDAAGNVVWKENYRPYGSRLNNPGAEASNKLGFAGKPFDPGTGALVITQAEHVATRTYGSKGVGTLQLDAGLSFHDVLARDIRDVRSIVGSKYNEGLRDLTDYFRRNFPNLMGK